MKCPNCSFFNEVRAEVCKICGTKLEKKIDKVTNTVSLDEALREKYMPSSVNDSIDPSNSDSNDSAAVSSAEAPAWELIPGLFVASSPRIPKKDSLAPADTTDKDQATVTESSGTAVGVEKPKDRDVATVGAQDSQESDVPASDTEGSEESELSTSDTENTEESDFKTLETDESDADPQNDVDSDEEDSNEEKSDEEESDEVPPTLTTSDVEHAEEDTKDKLAYIPPVYESLTGFERIDDEAPPVIVPPVVEYDVDGKDSKENVEYEDSVIKSSRDRWIVAIIVFLCILLVVLGAIIIRILWQWWHHDQPLTTTLGTTRTSTSTTVTTTTVTTTNPERGNPVIGKFTYDLQSYLVNSKTDFLAYMINPMEAKIALGDLHSLGVTKTEVEDVKYKDGILHLDTWIYNAVEDKIYKRLVKWEFNCTIGEYIDVKDFKHDFVLAEDEQKRQETSEKVEKTTETTLSATINSETSSTQPISTTTVATTQSTTETTTTAAAETTTFDESYFVKSGSVSGGSATESDALSKMRMGDHGYFQRLVFDFLGEKAPVYTASIDDGGYTLNLYLSNMTGHSGQPSIESWSTMTSIEVFSDSADSLQVQMRFREPIMINTFTIDDPGRIVIDIRGDSNWDTPQ